MAVELDFKISLPLILALGLQTAFFGFWLGQMGERIEHVEAEVARMRLNNDRDVAGQWGVRERLAGMEAQLRELKDTIRRAPASRSLTIPEGSRGGK